MQESHQKMEEDIVTSRHSSESELRDTHHQSEGIERHVEVQESLQKLEEDIVTWRHSSERELRDSHRDSLSQREEAAG